MHYSVGVCVGGEQYKEVSASTPMLSCVEVAPLLIQHEGAVTLQSSFCSRNHAGGVVMNSCDLLHLFLAII